MRARLADRYIPTDILPDKAIDVIDETGSRIKLKKYTPPQELKEIENDIQRFSEREKSLYKMHDLEKASLVRTGGRTAQKGAMSSCTRQWIENLNKDIPLVSEEDIEYTVSKMTGIPLSRLEEKESEKLIRMEEVFTRGS